MATRTPLTPVTWAELERLTRDSGRLIALAHGWMAEVDLAAEAQELTADYCNLDADSWRALVAAAASGLPVVIEHVNRLGGTSDRLERTTRTYIVDSLHVRGGVYDNLRVRCWGFSLPLTLSSLVSVTTPEATYKYEDA